MNILLINDNSAHPNWGAQATPYALIRLLKRSIPGVEVTTLSWDWLRQSHRRLRLPASGQRYVTPQRWGLLRPLIRRVSEQVRFYPKVADDFGAYADMWLAGNGGPECAEFIKLAGEADIIVYNGENSVYRNTTEGCRALFLLWFARTKLGKPSCLVNHTADLNEVRAIMNGMVQLVDPVLDLVAVRETRSLRNLHNLGIESAVLYPDVVFAEDPVELPESRYAAWARQSGLADHAYYCLSASGLPMSRPKGEWHGAVGDLVDALRGFGLRPVLLGRDPHCQFLGEVAASTGGLYFGPEHDFIELWSLFAGARFSITGHFHYIIIGSSVGCPFIPLSNNNHKISGVCEMLDWHRTEPFDATWLGGCRSEIVAEAQRILQNCESISRQLADRSKTLRAEARTLGDRIREIAEGGPGRAVRDC